MTKCISRQRCCNRGIDIHRSWAQKTIGFSVFVHVHWLLTSQEHHSRRKLLPELASRLSNLPRLSKQAANSRHLPFSRGQESRRVDHFQQRSLHLSHLAAHRGEGQRRAHANFGTKHRQTCFLPNSIGTKPLYITDPSLHHPGRRNMHQPTPSCGVGSLHSHRSDWTPPDASQASRIEWHSPMALFLEKFQEQRAIPTVE